MIKKILKIKNIGRYDIESSNDDLSFGRQTIIFGANKIGKTTLTSIFKSLKENNKNYIVSRKTFGSGSIDKQECEIIYNDGNKNIFDTNWNNSDIEIFDNEFIQRNVFIGDKIEQNHKAELYRILIDEKNLKIQAEIDDKEKENEQLRREKDQIKINIGKDFESFIKLEDKDGVDDIDNKIKENQDKQKQFYNQSRLNQLKATTKLFFNFVSFEEDVRQNIDTKLEQKIKGHIENCWNGENNNIDFLSLGIDKISEDKNVCPFCGQSLENVSELIKNMGEFFSNVYKQTQMSINKAINNFKEIDIEKEVAQFKAEGFEFKTKINFNDLNKHLKGVLSKIEEKQKDLSVDVKIEELAEYKSYKNVIETMNKEVDALKIETMNIYELQKEAIALKLNKERFSVEGIDKYKKYKKNEDASIIKKQGIDQSNTNLKNKLNSLFASYLVEINDVLEKSYANFKLTKLQSISNRTMNDKFFCDYAFIFDNTHDINILNDEDKPQFKNTLSDSDKRIFAFAFYVAKLKKDGLLNNKIVILDDPFTSLDEERRDSMIDILSNLTCKQIILLSHSRSFVKRCLLRFNKNIKDEDKDVKKLRLKNNSSNKTEISKLDINLDNDFLDGVEQYLNFLTSADASNIMSHYDYARKIIEHIVRTKYGNLLTAEEKKLPMKYFINTSCQSLMKDRINENDYQESHHDALDLPMPEELIKKRDDFINNVLPKI